MTAYERLIKALKAHGSEVGPNGRGSIAQCPGHDDGRPSLSITPIEGQALIHCFAGCDTADVMKALDLTTADLYDVSRTTYAYDDGREVHRSYDADGKKDFRQSGNTAGCPTLYRLDRVVIAVKAGDVVYLVEGEKDVHALESLDVVATTSPMGGGSFGKVDVSPLKGAHVVAIVDKDGTGQKWAAAVRERLSGYAAALEFREARIGKDAADHIAAGLGIDDFEPVAMPGDDDPSEVEFWQARPVLAHVHQFARARRAAPWAVLGVVLARTLAAVPPCVVLPPLTGADGSLNLFTALTGSSGAGKGAAIGVGTAAIEIRDNDVFSEGEGPSPVFVTKLGTGQGITRAYMELVPVNPDKPSGPKRWVQVRDRALFTNSEIDNITAHANQTAATLMSEIRSAFSGETLGQLYADATKSVQVPGHAYRFCMIVGVQPTRARALFDDVTGGTPQRFLWFPVRDPNRPDVAPTCPEPWPWNVPGVPVGRVEIDVCERARKEIDADYIARQDADDNADDLDAHAMFARLKVAAAFGMLEGRLSVTEEDWGLAGAVMAASLRTRGGIVSALRSENAQRSAAKRAEAVTTAVEVESATGELKIKAAQRRAKAVLGKLTPGAWLALGKIRADAGSRYRDEIPDALDRLVESGEIESQQSDNTVKYRITSES